MSGTSGSILSGKGGISLPQPVVRLVMGNNHPALPGMHDAAYVGGMTDPEFEAVQDRSPQIWLFRYKMGHNPKYDPHNTGYMHDKRRGYVHPSNWDGTAVGVRKVGGGGHHFRNGGTAQKRPSEWDVTKAHRYEAVFQPELWFLDRNSNPYSFPIQQVATSASDEYTMIGNSGQHGNFSGANPNHTQPGFCGSSQTGGVQKQWFAFAYAIKDTTDTRNYIIGPLSEVVEAVIWPKIKVNYGGCLPKFDRGRKIRLMHK